MSALGFPDEVVEGIKKSIDCSVYFFGNKVTEGGMYAVLGGSVALLIGIYILMNIFIKDKK